ncbi:hypothetical protein ACM66B_006731 [Microbotryomycetes sp. NB124-2]
MASRCWRLLTAAATTATACTCTSTSRGPPCVHASLLAPRGARNWSTSAPAHTKPALARDHGHGIASRHDKIDIKAHKSPKAASKSPRKATLDWHGQWRAAARAQRGKRLWPGFGLTSTQAPTSPTTGPRQEPDIRIAQNAAESAKTDQPATSPSVFWPKSSDSALEQDRLLKGLDMRQVLLDMHSDYVPTSPSLDHHRYPHRQASRDLQELYDRTAHLDHLGRLRLVWRTFRAYSRLGDDDRDLEAALTFLHYLAAPTSVSHTPESSHETIDMDTRLRASLECLQDLLESAITAFDVAVAPTWITKSGSSIPQHVSLRVILLRTIAPLALRTGSLKLAVKATTSLLVLRAEYAVSVTDTLVNPDVELVKNVLAAVRSTSRQDSLTTYDKRSTTSADANELLAFSVKLLDALAQVVAPTEPSPTGSTVQPEIAQALDLMADECGARHRPDLLSSMWLRWGLERGWHVAARWRIMIAKWANGSAYTQARLPAASQAVYDLVVEATTRDITSSRCDGWTNDERVSWVSIVACGPATPKTLSACRKVYTYWSQRFGSSFALSARASLKLATMAVKLGSRDFAQEVAISFIRRRTTAQSPFTLFGKTAKSASSSSASSAVIPHEDLTALAELYSLLGDHASVDHVFRHMLKSKMLPDARDIDVLLEWAASDVPNRTTEDETGSDDPLHQVLAFVQQHDVQLSLRNLKRALKAVLRMPAPSPFATRAKMDRLKRLFNEARACRLSELELDDLRLAIRSHLASHRRELAVLRRIETDEVNKSIARSNADAKKRGPVTILRPPWSDMGDLVSHIPEAILLPTSDLRRSSNLGRGGNADRVLGTTSDIVSRPRVTSLLLDCRTHKDVRLAVETFLFVADPSSTTKRASFFDDGVVRIAFKTILTGWSTLSLDERRDLMPKVARAFELVMADSLTSSTKRVTRRDTIDLVYQVGMKVLDDQERVARLASSGSFGPSARQTRLVEAYLKVARSGETLERQEQVGL